MAKRESAPDWGTPEGRVTWLLAHRHDGNRSAMAKATGVSLTGLIKVVTGQQTPGRRLMEKIVENTDVSPAWLFAGEGQPFRASAIPVVSTCLPGPPDPPGERGGTADAKGVSEVADLYAPSRYWLKLGAAEPAVRSAAANFKAGDLMLMETDRSVIPPAEQLSGRWGVVRIPGRGGPIVRLAELTYTRESDDDGPAYLEAETFVHHPLQVVRTVVDKYPDGQLEASERKVYVEQPKGDASNRSRKRWSSSMLQHQVAPNDVVALCILLVRRFG